MAGALNGGGARRHDGRGMTSIPEPARPSIDPMPSAKALSRKGSGRRAAPPPKPRAELAPPPDPAAERAAWILWAGLALLVVVRAALTFVPNMWAWSLNLQRFLALDVAWGPWTLAVLALAPPIARRIVPVVGAIGNFIAHSPRQAAAIAALFGAVLVYAMPDEVQFVGDFLFRQHTVEEGIEAGKLWPQALPLDVWLHYRLPTWLTEQHVTNPNGLGRAIGALSAAAYAALSVAFAHLLALEGAAALAVAAAMFFGTELGLFTGYSKALAEMTVVVALIGVTGLRAIRERRGLVALGLAGALALVLHRSSAMFLPATLLAWGLAVRGGGEARWKRRDALIALALPLIAAAIMAPRVIQILGSYDPVHIQSPR